MPLDRSMFSKNLRVIVSSLKKTIRPGNGVSSVSGVSVIAHAVGSQLALTSMKWVSKVQSACMQLFEYRFHTSSCGDWDEKVSAILIDVVKF